MTLIELQGEAHKLEAKFLIVAEDAGYADRWHYYQNERLAPATVHAAHDIWIAALHRFYLARDGERGVLGSRGL